MQLKSFHIFKKNGQNCLIDTEKMRAIPIDEITALFLEQATEDPSLIETSQIAATLNRHGLITKTPWR
jgi:hypothetical protein